MSIRIILADDHRIIRDGLGSLIRHAEGMEVVADADNGRLAVDLVCQMRPDVVVIDVSMPGLNGIDATRQIVSENSEVKVIGLSMHSDRRLISEMFKAGASGYLLKDCAFEELLTAIKVVMEGNVYLSPKVAEVVIQEYVHSRDEQDERSVFALLSDREREILQLLAEGKTTKQIAAECYVSVKTVETHRQHIMEKLNLHSLAELTKYAVREGLTGLEP